MNRQFCHIPEGTRVLVTGATGLTGSSLTRKLVEAGVKVNAIARDSSDISHLADLEIEWFRGDIADLDVIKAASEDVQYIFHLAAAFRDAKSTKDDYHRIHVASTQLLAKTAKEITNFKRLIHISTVGVHGHIEDPSADENYRFSPGDDYQETKAEAEIWLLDYAEKNDLPVTIIRPACIYGFGDRRLLKLFKMAKKKYFVLLGKGKCYYHLIHVDDLANAICLSATTEKAAGEILIIGNEEPIPIAEMAKIIASKFGVKSKELRLPIQPFFVAADVCEAVCRPFRIEPPIYRRRVKFYTNDRMFNTQKMRDVLGYQTQYKNKDGLEKTVDWYVDHGWL